MICKIMLAVEKNEQDQWESPGLDWLMFYMGRPE
jgi:hypothetical protein